MTSHPPHGAPAAHLGWTPHVEQRPLVNGSFSALMRHLSGWSNWLCSNCESFCYVLYVGSYASLSLIPQALVQSACSGGSALATRARLASARSILHNGPPARTRVRPSLLDLCHGTGRSSHAAAPAIVLGAYLSTHRARRVACHKPVSSSLRCCDSNASNAHLCLRTACSTRASLPHERAGGSNPPFPRPSHCWLGGGRRPPCGGGDTCNTSTPRFGVLDPSQRAARKDACAALSTRPVPQHGSI